MSPSRAAPRRGGGAAEAAMRRQANTHFRTYSCWSPSVRPSVGPSVAIICCRRPPTSERPRTLHRPGPPPFRHSSSLRDILGGWPRVLTSIPIRILNELPNEQKIRHRAGQKLDDCVSFGSSVSSVGLALCFGLRHWVGVLSLTAKHHQRQRRRRRRRRY